MSEGKFVLLLSSLCLHEKSTQFKPGYLNSGQLKKKLFMTLVKITGQTSFREITGINIGVTTLEVCSRGERLSSTLNATGRSGDFIAKVGRSTDRKLLRGNIRDGGRGGFWLKTSLRRKVGNKEFVQRANVTRH